MAYQLQGCLQPFKVDSVPGEVPDYSVNISGNSEKKIGIAFTPLYSDMLGTKLAIYSNVENTADVADNDGYYYSFNFPILLKSSAAPNEINTKLKMNNIAQEFDTGGKQFPIYVLTTITNGELDMKPVNKGISPQYFKKNDKLCIVVSGLINVEDTSSPDNNGQVRGYLLVDNKLLKAFSGQYYFDCKLEKGKYYEIPLDMSVMPKTGTHLVTFITYGINYSCSQKITIT
jgi:hypothetical protein